MKEVLSCFYSDNLRSAVVMLYATVVSDLYYKILDLVAIYNDAGAKQIKQYVDNEWQRNPKLPTWETEMPKMCWKKKKILAWHSYVQIQTLPFLHWMLITNSSTHNFQENCLRKY